VIGMDKYDPVSMIRGTRRVTLSWIGEGYYGDYDPTSPDDERLLRFDIDELVDGEWEPMTNGSYCTGLTADAPRQVWADAVLLVMDCTHDRINVKREAEELSYMNAGWFEGGN
jgi:hypothetical protein